MQEIWKIVDDIDKAENKQQVIVDDLRRELVEHKVNRGLEASLFYLLNDCLGFSAQNVGTETAKIGAPNARIFAWAENDGVEIEIIVKRKGRL